MRTSIQMTLIPKQKLGETKNLTRMPLIDQPILRTEGVVLVMEKARKRRRIKKKGRRRRKESEKHLVTEKKKERAPGQPKRGLSSYFMYVRDNREKVIADNP